MYERFGGPSFYEGEPAATEIARAELMRELSEVRAAMMEDSISAEIARNPELDFMMSRLIESGAELDPAIQAHLRKMIAIWIGREIKSGTQARQDVDFYNLVVLKVEDELREMSAFEADLSNLPDLWDLAYQDLMRLEGGE